MNAITKKSIALTLIGAVVIQLSGCGTILHPERKGQGAGQLDPGVVVLDAIGLLFFFVPGVIAFAVDFNNGTIYLPGGTASINSSDVNIVNVEGELTNEMIEQIILEQAGTSISLEDNEIVTSEKTTTLSALHREVRFL